MIASAITTPTPVSRHPVESITDIGVGRGIKEDDAQYNSARLHCSHPKILTEEDQDDHTNKQKIISAG